MMHGRRGVGRGFGGGLRRRLRLMEEAHGRLHQGVWLRLSGTVASSGPLRRRRGRRVALLTKRTARPALLRTIHDAELIHDSESARRRCIQRGRFVEKYKHHTIHRAALLRL